MITNGVITGYCKIDLLSSGLLQESLKCVKMTTKKFRLLGANASRLQAVRVLFSDTETAAS